MEQVGASTHEFSSQQCLLAHLSSYFIGSSNMLTLQCIYCYCSFINIQLIIPKELTKALMIPGFSFLLSQVQKTAFFGNLLFFFPKLISLIFIWPQTDPSPPSNEHQKEEEAGEEVRRLEEYMVFTAFPYSCLALEEGAPIHNQDNTTPLIPLSFYIQLLKLALCSQKIEIRSIFKLCSGSSTLLNQR